MTQATEIREALVDSGVGFRNISQEQGELTAEVHPRTIETLDMAHDIALDAANTFGATLEVESISNENNVGTNVNGEQSVTATRYTFLL